MTAETLIVRDADPTEQLFGFRAAVFNCMQSRGGNIQQCAAVGSGFAISAR